MCVLSVFVVADQSDVKIKFPSSLFSISVLIDLDMQHTDSAGSVRATSVCMLAGLVQQSASLLKSYMLTAEEASVHHRPDPPLKKK